MEREGWRGRGGEDKEKEEGGGGDDEEKEEGGGWRDGKEWQRKEGWDILEKFN